MAWQGIRVGIGPRDILRAIVLVLPLFLLALSGDWLTPSPIAPVLRHVWLPVALAIGIVVGFGWPVLRRAVATLRQGRLGGDLLICLGALAGIALSLWQMRQGALDAAAQLLVWRDAAFAGSLIAVAGLGDLAARADRVPASSAAKGGSETISVAPGDLIPVDGTVRDGRSEIQDPHGADDIFPSVVARGDRVHAGSRNGDSVLLIVPLPSALPPRLPVRDGGIGATVTAWAVPAMLLAAVLVFAWRWVMGPPLSDPIEAGLRLAMLSAPLGLGLVVAAPAAELLRATREMGLEVHDLAVLARLTRLRAVIFGHRGVLIPERHRVISVQTPDGDHGSELIARAASVAQAGHDPWGRSLLDLAVSYRMRLKNAHNYHAEIGEGVMADVGDRPTLLGSREFLQGHGIDCSPLDQVAEAALAQGRRLRWVGEGGAKPGLLGFIAFGAPSVAGAVVAVKNLARLDLATAWLADDADPAHVALLRHLRIKHMLPMTGDTAAAGVAAFSKGRGPVLFVTAEPLADDGVAGLRMADTILPFGRRAAAEWPQAPMAITRQDPSLVVDVLRLADRYRRLILTNTAIVFGAAAIVAFGPFLLGQERDLASYEIAVILLLVVSSLSLRAVPSTANEVDEE